MPAAPPDPDSDFRRRAAALLQRQLAGLVPPPGRISQDELAAGLGLSRRQVRQLEARALQKLRKLLTTDHQP